MSREAHGLPLGSRRRLVVISVALVVTVLAGALLAARERPPSEPLAQLAFLVDDAHDEGAVDEVAHRELDGGVGALADAVDEDRWDDALLAVEHLRATLHRSYDDGRIEVGVARRIEGALDDVGHAVRAAQDG